MAISDWAPLSFNRKTTEAYPEGYVPKSHESLEVRRASISPDYFRTMQIPLVQGREFSLRDDSNAPRVVIVDETTAMRQFFISLFFKVGAPETILHLRSKGNPLEQMKAIASVVHGMNAKLPIYDARTLTESMQAASTFERMGSTLVGFFGLTALCLSATGVYGVISYSTQQRRHEIGIRMALGSPRSAIAQMIFSQGMALTLNGVSFGLIASLLVTKGLKGQLYGVSSSDPFTLTLVTLLLVVVSLLACYLPAHRAMRVDPIQAVRAE